MKVYACSIRAANGQLVTGRFLLEKQELAFLEAVGAVQDACEIVGMQTIADATMAAFELESLIASGGKVQ